MGLLYSSVPPLPEGGALSGRSSPPNCRKEEGDTESRIRVPGLRRSGPLKCSPPCLVCRGAEVGTERLSRPPMGTQLRVGSLFSSRVLPRDVCEDALQALGAVLLCLGGFGLHPSRAGTISCRREGVRWAGAVEARPRALDARTGQGGLASGRGGLAQETVMNGSQTWALKGE